MSSEQQYANFEDEPRAFRRALTQIGRWKLQAVLQERQFSSAYSQSLSAPEQIFISSALQHVRYSAKKTREQYKRGFRGEYPEKLGPQIVNYANCQFDNPQGQNPAEIAHWKAVTTETSEAEVLVTGKDTDVRGIVISEAGSRKWWNDYRKKMDPKEQVAKLANASVSASGCSK